MNNFEIPKKSINNTYAFILKELIINLENNIDEINKKLKEYDNKLNKNNSILSSSESSVNTILKINENKSRIIELEKKANEQEIFLKSQEKKILENLEKINDFNKIYEKTQNSLNDYERKLSTIQLNNLQNDNLLQDIQNIKSKLNKFETLEDKLQEQIDTLEKRIDQ